MDDYVNETKASMITIDEDVMGGVPCIRDTRIPVLDVAASVRVGIPMEEILGAYPDLNETDVQYAYHFCQGLGVLD